MKKGLPKKTTATKAAPKKANIVHNNAILKSASPTKSAQTQFPCLYFAFTQYVTNFVNLSAYLYQTSDYDDENEEGEGQVMPIKILYPFAKRMTIVKSTNSFSYGSSMLIVGSIIYISGGCPGCLCCGFSNDMYKVSLITKNTEQLAALPERIMYHTMIFIYNQLLLQLCGLEKKLMRLRIAIYTLS